MGAIKTGSSKVLTEGKQTARVGDGVLITAAEMAAALGGKAKPPTAPKGVGTGAPPLAPSAGGAGGSYEPTMDYEGNLQPGVPGSAIIDLDRGANSTYGTLQDFVNLFASPGLLTGGSFSSNATHLIVEAGTVLLRIEDDDKSAVKFFDFPETSFVIPNDTETHYVAVILNGGEPYVVENTTNDFDKDTEIPLGSTTNVAGNIFFLFNPYKTSDAMTNVIQRFDAILPITRDASVGGLLLESGPSRSIQLSGGKIWSRLSDYDIADKDSAVDGMLTVHWNGTDLQFTPTLSWDNTKYNNVANGTLDTLDDNKYACLWFFAAAQSGVFGFAYGDEQHNSIADAGLEQIPDYLAAGFRNQTLFLGRLIFKKGASSPSALDSAFLLNLPVFSEQERIGTFYDSTGIISGGNLTINANNQTFDCSAGIAVFMDFTIPGQPAQDVLEFGPFTGVVIPGIATRLTTYIGINNSGAVVQQATPFTATQRRTIASLGLIVHSNLVNINATNIIATTVHAPTNQLHDLMDAMGALNVFGNVFSANGANLQLNKSAGRIFKIGANFQNNNSDPHGIDIAAQTSLTFRYRLQNGTEFANTTSIDPNNYDVGGVLTDITPALRFTIQHINMFQSGLTRIQYGQNLYGSMAEAEAALASEAFNVEQNIADNGIFRAYLIIQDTCTDLSDTSKAKFVAVTKFGALAAGGVSISNTDALPQGSVNLYFANTLARIAMESNVVRIAGTGGANDLIIAQATADGADTGRINITSANAIGSSRGAYIQLNGNEQANTPGRLLLSSGIADGVEIFSNSALAVNSALGLYLPAVLGDKISLFDNRLSNTTMYGLGVEANYLYTKAVTGVKMYFGVNADTSSHALQFSNAGITFNLANQKIVANFTSSSPFRTIFQTSVVDGATNVSAAPNGTSKVGIFTAFNSSDTLNASTAQLRSEDGFIAINSGKTGTGNTVPIRMQLDSVTKLEVSNSGIELSGTSQRIKADFSSSPFALRTAFQTTIVNGSTVVSAITNGTGATSAFRVHNGSDPDNSTLGGLRANATEIVIESQKVGTGTALPIQLWIESVPKAELTVGGIMRMLSSNVVPGIPTSGKGLELMYRTDSGIDKGQIDAFDRATTQFKPLDILAQELVIGTSTGANGAGSTATLVANTLGVSVMNGHLRSNTMHNNATSPTGASVQYVASGTYTPALTNVANITSSVAAVCQWMRVGNVVTVSGRASITPTTTATATELGIALPLASAFTNTDQCNGAGASEGVVGQVTCQVLSDATNDRARLLFYANTAGSARFFSFTFSYLVL